MNDEREFTFVAPKVAHVKAALLAAARGEEVATSEAESPYHWQFFGDPLLHMPTRDVTPEDMPHVVGVLLPAMRMLHGGAWTRGVGLSANQAGSNLRVAIAQLEGKPGRELSTLINLQILERSADMRTDPQEGCLSLPYFRTTMRRHVWVVATWRDELWQPQQRKLNGIPAQVIQHECEHLAGKTILDGKPRQQRRQAERELARYRGLR